VKVQQRDNFALIYSGPAANLPLLQQGSTKRIIKALGLDSKFSTPEDTPADTAALGKDVDGKNASGSINYASVIGMLLYLGHRRPDISFAMHQCGMGFQLDFYLWILA
jgi:hypothetical protein